MKVTRHGAMTMIGRRNRGTRVFKTSPPFDEPPGFAKRDFYFSPMQHQVQAVGY